MIIKNITLAKIVLNDPRMFSFSWTIPQNVCYLNQMTKVSGFGLFTSKKLLNLSFD